VFVLVGATVARANNPNACVDCRNYWGWWAANRTMAQGGCSDHPNVNQSNNKGVCIANVQNAHCAAICAANPPSSPVSSCDGEEGILSACAANAEVACHGLQEAEAASGPCTQGCWDAQCDGWFSSKRCRLKHVNQGCRPMSSVCYANCECQLPP
jgi:hypothetical protein